MDTLLPASGRKMKLAGCSISTRYGKSKQHDDLVLMLLTNPLKSPIADPIGCLMAGKVNRNECQRFSLAMGGFQMINAGDQLLE
jgi:hypothetical protein